MKNKNLALMAALSAGFLIQGISTAYADDTTILTVEKPYKVASLENDLSLAEDKTNYSLEDINKLETEVELLLKEFDELNGQIKNVEEKGVTKPTAEEKAIAQAQWDKGSIGFFEANGSYEAIDVFKSLPLKKGIRYKESTGGEYLYLNRIGSKIDENDSRSLDNMKDSIEALREVNAKRQRDGGIDGRRLSTIGISDFDMAVAQANANYSSINPSHASIYGPPYENLAWSYNDPSATKAIDQWWNQEKPVFDYLRAMGLQSRTEMEAYIDRNKDAMKARFENPQVGHYLNLVDSLSWRTSKTQSRDSISAGYALKKTGYYPFTKSIVMNPSTDINREVYSIDDYEAKFLAYYNELNNIVNLDIKTVDKGSLEEITRLKKEAETLEKRIKAKKEILTKLKDEKAKLDQKNKNNEKYIKLKKSVENNRIVVKAAQFLLDFAPEKVRHVKPRLLNLIADSEAKVKKAEAILAKNGML